MDFVPQSFAIFAPSHSLFLSNIFNIKLATIFAAYFPWHPTQPTIFSPIFALPMVLCPHFLIYLKSVQKSILFFSEKPLNKQLFSLPSFRPFWPTFSREFASPNCALLLFLLSPPIVSIFSHSLAKIDNGQIFLGHPFLQLTSMVSFLRGRHLSIPANKIGRRRRSLLSMASFHFGIQKNLNINLRLPFNLWPHPNLFL